MYRRRFNTRVIMITMVAVLALTIVVPMASYAGEKGRRNTAIALTGLAAVLLAKDKPAAGILAAVGAVAAWNNVDQGRRYDRRGHYGSYGGGYYNGYNSDRDDRRSDRNRDRNDRAYGRDRGQDNGRGGRGQDRD